MKKLTSILFVILFLSILYYPFSAASAAVPRLINYQGRLTDTSGNPLTGSYALTFRIYDAETAGNLLWEETQSGVVIQKGVFSVLLGSVKSLNLAFDKPYFLEIKVGSEVMSPRQRITSAAYAIKAESADSLTIPAQQGDILYYSGSIWSKLPAGSSGQLLKTQGAGNNPAWTSVSPYNNIQVFTASGTFIKPEGVNKVYVEVIGGGGNGGKGAVNGAGGGGGGAGGYSAKICTLNGNVAVTVGGASGASSFGSFCSAAGGSKGEDAYLHQFGGRGGTGGNGVNGDINLSGGSGGPGSSGNSAKMGGNGGNSVFGGAGGGGVYNATSRYEGKPGAPNTGAGGGGGGSGDSSFNSGGAGATGVVIVRW